MKIAVDERDESEEITRTFRITLSTNEIKHLNNNWATQAIRESDEKGIQLIKLIIAQFPRF